MENKILIIGNEHVHRCHIVKVRPKDLPDWFSVLEFHSSSLIQEAEQVLLDDGMMYTKSLNRWTDTMEDTTPQITEVLPIEIPFKYDEDRLLKEFSNYVASTYGKHYVGEDNVQSLDLIFATGHGEGFCIGNVLKYGARCGKKVGQERDDLLKAMHYAMLCLYQLDKESNKHAKV